MRMSRRDLYALGEPFGDSATRSKAGSKNRIYGGGDGGGSAAPTQTTVQNTNLPEYVQPYVMSMLGAAQNQMFNMNPAGDITGFKPYTPYSANPTDYVAGFSPLQKQAQQGTANLQLPGQYQAGSQLAGASGLGSLGIAGQAANAGQNYYGMATNPYAMQSFMNPYIQTSLAPQLAEIGRQGQINANQAASQATTQGAFGGTRGQLAQAEAQRNALMAQQQAIGQGYNQAYNQAQQAMQYGAGLGLQGQQAALQGMGQANQAAGTLANIGQQQLTGQEGILAAQSTAGAQQQAQQQQIVNQAIQNYAQQQQMPLQSLSNLSALLHGLPLQNTTTQSYQAAPSTVSQIAGLGTGIAGISKLAAKGGSVSDIKKMAGGGIASLENRQRIAANYPPQVLQREVQSGVLPQGIGADLTQDYSNMQKAVEGMKAQQAMAQAAQPQDAGIPGLPSNLPVQGMAGGGIIAFDAGGDTSSTTKKTKTTSSNPLAFSWDYKPQELSTGMTDQEIAQYNNPVTGKPYTSDEYTNMMNKRRGDYGISDIYTAQTEDVKARKEKLSGAREQAKGLALLAAAGKMLGSTSPYAGVGIGSGLGEYATNYGTAAEKLDTREEALAKENNEIARAQMAMKQAWMNQDTTQFQHEQDNLNKALNAKQGILNQNTAAVNQGQLEKNKELNSYNEKIRAQEISSASAHNTDLRWLASVNYQDLVKKGMPANEATASMAADLATKQIGMTGAKVANAAAEHATTADIALQGKINDAVKSDALIGDKGTLKIALLQAGDDAKAVDAVKKQIDARKLQIEAKIRADNPHLIATPMAPAATTQAAPAAAPNVLQFDENGKLIKNP